MLAPRAGVRTPEGRNASSFSVSDAVSGCGGVARWRLIEGASWSARRGRARGGMFGLLRTGGGDRSLGETGHRGDSRRRSWVVGDLTGALVLDSEAAGRRVGVVEEDRVRTVEDRAGLAGRPAREGLRSVMLFFRDPGAGVVEEAREMLVLDKGRAGDGSREASGEGAAEDEAEWEDDVCETRRGHRSVLGVMVAVLEVDSRESVGRRVGVLVGESAEPFAALDDLSIVGCRACGRAGV